MDKRLITHCRAKGQSPGCRNIEKFKTKPGKSDNQISKSLDSASDMEDSAGRSDDQFRVTFAAGPVDAAEVDSDPLATAFDNATPEGGMTEANQTASQGKGVKLVPVVTGPLPVRPDPPYLISAPDDRMACCTKSCHQGNWGPRILTLIAVVCLVIVVFVAAFASIYLT
uniref:LEM domain-containing protein n=1 Tax=Trichuris muris TaxID=70415 RepID=A0A5S6QPL8_TRIMR